jgi:hypothetical protein
MKHIKLFEEFQYENYLMNVVNEMATPKDIKRISDIISKSGGNEGKAVQLATQMANIIKDKNKALQRYEAALEIVGKDHPVTQVFANLASSMGHNVDKVTVASETLKNTHGKLGSDPSLKSKGIEWTPHRYSRNGGSALLPLGSTNLVTGKCKYFNIYNTWGKGDDTTIELWQTDTWGRDDEGGKFKLVFTSGSGPIYKIGTHGGFDHDQNGRPLFNGTLVDWVNIGDADLLVKKYNVKAAPGYVYK